VRRPRKMLVAALAYVAPHEVVDKLTDPKLEALAQLIGNDWSASLEFARAVVLAASRIGAQSKT